MQKHSSPHSILHTGMRVSSLNKKNMLQTSAYLNFEKDKSGDVSILRRADHDMARSNRDSKA